MDPITRSTYGFCQGLDGLEMTSVDATRRRTTFPYHVATERFESDVEFCSDDLPTTACQVPEGQPAATRALRHALLSSLSMIR